MTPLASAAITAALALQAATTPKVGLCDPPAGPRIPWAKAERLEVRRRAHAFCRSLGASSLACAWVDASIVRESSGRPSVRHTKGRGEDGIGILGLDKRSHRDKWPDDPEPAWCSPEASVIVALDIGRRAVRRSRRDGEEPTISYVQAVFSMRSTYRDEDGRLHVAIDPNSDLRLCKAMRARGHGCRERVSAGDFGEHVPLADRPRRAQIETAHEPAR